MALGFQGSAQTQIISDGTLSTRVTSADNQNFVIENGDRTGNNLFHSFSEFSIPTNGSAVFNNATTLENIFGRITGNNVSNIDGLIQANGIANVFLLNPHGIVFGENASLNIGGSFVASTAETILFSDTVEFHVTDAATAPLLAVSTPVGLGLGDNPGPIAVLGPGHGLTTDFIAFSPVIRRDNRPMGLQVNAGETLALIGGDILLEGGNLTANQGRIELGSVAQSGMVSLIPATNGFTLGYATIDSFGDLTFTQAASVDVSGEGSGNLHFQAGNLAILEASAIISYVLGAEQGGDVRVRASESVEIRGSQTGVFPSGFFNQGELGSTGNVGNLLIETGRLEIAEIAVISNRIAGGGNGGSLTIIANEVDLKNDTPFSGRFVTSLSTQVLPNGTGQGGDLVINAGTFRNFGERIFIESSTLGQGDAGNISIQVDMLEMIGEVSAITAASTAEGKAGAINLQVDTLRLVNGGQFNSVAFGQGDGGNITIQANNVELAGFASGIFAVTAPDAQGNGGTIDLQIENRLQIEAGAQISTTSFGTGEAGDILLQANEIEVRGATDFVGPPALTSSQISAISNSAFPAGNIDITVEELRVEDEGLISVSSLGLGDASNLTIVADQILLRDGGMLQAEVAAGNQGNIFLNADSLLFMDGGALISTNATNQATGGNITIESPVILGLNNSDIVANAVQGDGGNIEITTQALLGLKFRDFLTPKSDITASSQFGLDGIVQIDTSTLEPNQGLAELPSDVADPSNQIFTGCLVAADSSLTVSGRSSLPDSPNIPNSSAVWEDWRPLETEEGTATLSKPVENAPLTEATNVVIAANGHVEFVSPSETLMNPNQLSCGGRS
ncbi:filamentous hemagglutinin family outer membrane protein [Leptolyngbya sp. Heron Island J]|uniref:two-partner secretion domain-containing protein n=1 Tax=Leptolyngbya sp. Heron Island J TaxID=1385935 RepID=UPI0003B9DE18|nr:filamentous hemagglutinin N-terminal domain-containing protein [Leptolyngbya sp. Heron Island J]ESA36004.1 filamentous hemagglutinin family outer membrane protein [Leptolyngbya sp. Heron Island J]